MLIHYEITHTSRDALISHSCTTLS